MHNLPSLSSCILSGIVAAPIAFDIAGSPIDFLSGKQLPRSNPQVLAANVSSTKYVDRSHKSDRLPMQRAEPIVNTTIIKKNADTPDYIIRVANVTSTRLNTLGTADGKRSPIQSWVVSPVVALFKASVVYRAPQRAIAALA